MQPSEHQLMLLALVSGGFALLGAVVGTLVTGVFNLRAKRNEYVNDYYKTVIQRRIAAYEALESLIVAFKISVVDDGDGNPYHAPFSREDPQEGVFIPLHAAMSQGLWLSDEAFEKTTKLNYLAFRVPAARNEAIDFGKKHYKEIAELRDALECTLAADMLEMPNVERFLAQKKSRRSGFREVRL